MSGFFAGSSFVGAPEDRMWYVNAGVLMYEDVMPEGSGRGERLGGIGGQRAAMVAAS